MRISVLTSFAVSILSLGIGCKHKTEQNPPPTGSGSAATPGSAAAAADNADVVLPTSPGTPPVKTTKPLERDALKKMSELEYPGFNRVLRSFENTTLEVRQTTARRPKIAVTMLISPCNATDAPGAGSGGSGGSAGSAGSAGSGSAAGSGAAAISGLCIPMKLDAWKPHSDELKLLMSKGLRERPDTQWEIGQVDAHGTPVIYTYQLGQWFGVGEDGKQHGSFSDAFILYYNDGVNQIRVVSEYKDDPVGSKDDLSKLAPKQDLQKAALAFFDAYTHAWS